MLSIGRRLMQRYVLQPLDVASHAHVLENGAFQLPGPAAEIAADPDLRRAYLGM